MDGSADALVPIRSLSAATVRPVHHGGSHFQAARGQGLAARCFTDLEEDLTLA